ncbi:MAG: cupin [Chloroflexota bacterium]|nr:cupin [Chloroflexota bacterium]
MASQSGASAALAGPPLERVPKPWGEELILNRTAETVVKALRIRPWQRLSLQYHRRKHETLMLLSGDAILIAGTSVETLRENPLREGACQEVEAGVIHRLSAGSSGADILEIASRLPDDVEDIVRLADDYGRVDIPARV